MHVVGGVKEKSLAAYRAGLREVILPASNEKDLREVPDEVRQHMVFTFVSSMDEVLRLALLPNVPAGIADQSVAAPVLERAAFTESASQAPAGT